MRMTNSSLVVPCTNAMLNEANVAMGNITDSGKTVIRNLAKEAVKVVDGEHTYVTSKTDGNATAYAVNITTGRVVSGDGGLVTGGAVYDAIQDIKASGGSGQPVDISGKADVSAGNVGQNFTKYSDNATTDELRKNERIANENAWGNALGTGQIANSDATVTDADTNGSKQLVTGNTVYKEVRPASNGTYIKTANTTAQNLTALDAQVAANTSTLNNNTHNIKYYAVNDQEPLSKIDGYSNEGNDGAKGRGSIAAGFNTHADGVASTVVGSYSGVLNQNGNRDFRGATALSYGTFNINQNTDTKKSFSGVANSIIGQANATTNSNAAIIYGAGNTVTNSYRGIDGTNVSDIMKAASSKDVKKLYEALQKAVPNSGAQVMVMGGGNSVDKAYMTQVTGVGNKVSGQNSIYEKGTSTQYNFVDGFQNELSNGQHDYIIGTENKVSGDSVDKNQSNIIFGDNHKLTNQTNNVIIGSSDKADDETTVSDIVAIGHNAKVSAEGGVAIGSGSAVAASTEKVSGYDPTTKAQSTDKTSSIWNATTGAVSIGTADGTVTRQLNGVAAGTNDTDAVNVAQLKKLEGMKANLDASNIGSNITVAPIYKKDDSGKDVIDPDATKKAEDDARTANENAWGTAIGTGEVAKDNGQLVTGKTVYDALHGGLDDVVFGHDGKDGQPGKDGSIGLVGPKGQDGKDGKTTTIIKTETGAAGVNGKDGKDGITRIYYYDQTNTNDKHTVATLDDGMKFGDDFDSTATVKLNHQLDIVGDINAGKKNGDKKAKKDDLSDGNIGVVATDTTYNEDGTVNTNGKMTIKLAKDLKGLHSSTYTTTETTGEGDNKQTTDYTTTIDSKGVTIQSKGTKDGKPETVNGPSMTIDGINGGGKQITNVGDGFKKNADGSYTISETDKKNAANIGDVQTIVDKATKDLTDGTNGLNSKANVDASNIGENLKDAKGNKASADAIAKNKEDWASAIGTNEVKEGNKQLVTSDAVAKELAKKADKSYVDQELGKKADKTYVDEKLDTKANKSDVYTKNETYSKSEVDSKVTDITNGLDGKAGKDLDDISDKGKTAIHNIAKDAVEVVKGKNTTVTKVEGTDTTPTAYAVNVEGTGKVASGDTGLISGDTLYKEVHVDKDGSYIKGSNTVGQNLSALDTGLKTTSDLIHTNTKGDTIQIGGNSTATKIDVSGKDANGNTTGRVITGVVSDASDPNSAANVGYVNGLTAANTQQIYRDMNNAYSRLDTNINRAAAGSNALAALHPLDFDPADKASFAVGYGHYHNANAAAVGAFYQPNANTMVNMGISLGNGDPGFNAGVSFKIGKGSAYNGVSKAEMAQTIHDQAAEISTIKANDAAKDKRIDALEKENQEIKKQIQEILARLNG